MPNQHTGTPKDWTWAGQMYGASTMPAEAIARAVGCSLTYLYAKMNRANIKKRRAHRMLKAGTPERYKADAVDAAILKDLSARDAELLVAKPLIRCPECCGVSRSNRCVCGAVKNPFLAVD